VFGKINIIDIAASSPFRGGAGIDAFWNTVFAATPSGSVVNKSGFEEPFTDGVTFRGSVEFPVAIAGRRGHQGFVALYSTKSGTDLEGLDDILIPPFPETVDTKNNRYYFAYSFDQYL
jgi:porin